MSSLKRVNSAKTAMFGWISAWISGASRPEWVPGLAPTKRLKFRMKFGSANLFRPDRKNSMPSAAWIIAEAARPALPLAGMRFISLLFMPMIGTHQDLMLGGRRPDGTRLVTRRFRVRRAGCGRRGTAFRRRPVSGRPPGRRGDPGRPPGWRRRRSVVRRPAPIREPAR